MLDSITKFINQLDTWVWRKFDSLFSSNTSQSLYWLYFFVKVKLCLYTLHYVVV